MAKGKYKTKKTVPEVQNYKEFIFGERGETQQTLDDNLNPSLMGSDEVYEEKHYKKDITPVAKKPLKYEIKDWWKENKISFILGVVIVGFVTWATSNIISLDKRLDNKIDLYEYRISQIELEITNIDGDSVTKEMLNLQMDALKAELEKNQISTANDVEGRLMLIESQIELLNKQNNLR